MEHDLGKIAGRCSEQQVIIMVVHQAKGVNDRLPLSLTPLSFCVSLQAECVLCLSALPTVRPTYGIRRRGRHFEYIVYVGGEQECEHGRLRFTKGRR